MENYLSGARAIRPIGDNVLVKLDPAPLVTEGLAVDSVLVTPGTAKYRPIDAVWATVVAVPENLRSYRRHCNQCHRPYDEYDDRIVVGQRVAVDSEKAGDAVLLDGVEHRIVKVAELHLAQENESEAIHGAA